MFGIAIIVPSPPKKINKEGKKKLMFFVNYQEYQEQLSVVKIDHDSNPRLIEEYKVYGLPALILFKNGKEVPESRREGAITKAKLKAYLDALLESVSVP